MLKQVLLFFFLFAMSACTNKGDQIPEFNLKTIEGKSISNKDLKGKITIINVWATWCHSCLNELPELNELAEKYALDTSVIFFAISDESAEKINRFVQKKPSKFIQAPDAAVLTRALQTRLVRTYPQHLIIGKDLKIKFEHTGELKNARELLSTKIESLR